MRNNFMSVFKSHRRLVVIAAAVAVAGLGYGGYRLFGQTAAATRYVTAAVERGALVISVSGTGQIAAEDQVDVKSEVSGDIAGIYAVKDREVKAGALLAALDTRSAQKAIRDAQVALDDAQTKLDDMLAPTDAQTLLQAENAVAQAQHSLDQAVASRAATETDGVQNLQTAYEDAYDNSSTSLFKLTNYLEDLKDVLGDATDEQSYVRSYRLLLGSDSPLVQATVDDYYGARDDLDATLKYFNGVERNGSRDAIYQLIDKMVTTTNSITGALESARRMYDAITASSYESLKIATTIDTMKPKVENDISAAYTSLSSLRDNKETIDDTTKNNPDLIADADWTVTSAQNTLKDKQLALADLQAGYTAQEIKSQRNVVAQKQDVLMDARENLTKYSIRAPFAGMIAAVESGIKKGDTVSSGTTLATIVTLQKIVTISLNEVDIAKIEVGQKATVAFDAIEDLTMTGTVAEIDSLGTVTQGVVNYGVQIALDDQDDRVKPGMTVSAAIVTEMKPDVLLVPNTAVKTENGAHYVETLSGSGASVGTVTSAVPPQHQAVEIGLADDISTEITSGLKEGDIIVTRTVTSSTTGTATTGSSAGGGSQNSAVRIPGLGDGGFRGD